MHDDAFLRTIAAAPDDDAPRLVYADWLEERGDAGAAALARSEHVRGLHGLDLSFNSLSNGGVQVLLDAGSWPALTALDLRGNDRVTGRGATALAHTQALPALEALDLRDNEID